MRHGQRPDRLPARRLPVPAAVPIPAVSGGLAAWTRTSHSLRRVLACAAADHLHQAAAILREAPSVDALLLGAARTAEVIGALDVGARQFGAALPNDLAASAERLRRWAMMLKQQPAPAPWPACDNHHPTEPPLWESP